MEVKTYDQLLRYLEKEAVNHIAYYHYTRWECLRKMLTDSTCKDGARHKFLLLTRASKTNDGIEEKWPKNYYMACFSLSRYEDVAMWLNYGKRQPDSVRIKITRDAMDDWLAIKKHDVYSVHQDKGEIRFGDNISGRVKSVKLYGLAYVIPSHHWVTEADAIFSSPGSSEYVTQDSNIELGRKFFKVAKNGSYKWVDAIYKGKDLSKKGIPPVFKKRGWAYEREIRLVVEMDPAYNVGDRIAVAFDRPFDELLRYMNMPGSKRKKCLLGGVMTPKVKVLDHRFPMIQSGPWYDGHAGAVGIGKFKLRDAFHSEYQNEIKMIFPGDEKNSKGVR